MVKGTKRRGFTLIEVVTTIFIIGLLILLVLPNVNHVREYAEEKQKTALVHTIQTQVELYQSEYPNEKATVKDLVAKQYLTEAQLAQANKMGITVVGTQVIRDK